MKPEGQKGKAGERQVRRILFLIDVNDLKQELVSKIAQFANNTKLLGKVTRVQDFRPFNLQ